MFFGASGESDAHEEVIAAAGPVGFVTVLADEGSQLRVVADAMEHRVEEHRLAGGAGRAVAAGDEVDDLVPVEVGGEGLMVDAEGAVVGGVEGVYGAEGDLVEVGFGEAGDALGPA